jgi:putative PIN family toxin of toxin-antitoxin system
MRVVIDTNVLVSAALRDRDPEQVILFVVSRPDVVWVVTSEILREYKDVLSRAKFGLGEALCQRWFDLLDSATTRVEADVAVEFARDRKDAKFLACAVSASADYLVTGDRDFELAAKVANVTIVSVGTFRRLVCDPLAP